MKRWHRITMIALCGLWASTAVAQDGPAIDTSGGNLGGALSDGAGAEADAPADGAQQPALDTGSAGGTSVIGDTESPIGLYIIPWRSTSWKPSRRTLHPQCRKSISKPNAPRHTSAVSRRPPTHWPWRC